MIKKSAVRVSLFFMLLVCGLFFLSFLYMRNLRESLADESKGYLKEIAYQSAAVIRTKIESDLTMLDSVAGFLGAAEDFDLSSSLEKIKTEVGRSKFKRMGLIDLDGNSLTTDGYTMDLGGREYYRIALDGISNLAVSTMTDIIDGKDINVYAVPVFHQGQIVAVLFATHSAETFQELLSIPIFRGEGYSYIIENDGTPVILSNHPDSKILGETFSVVFSDETDVPKIFSDLKEGKSNVFELYVEGKKKYVSYVPVGINDWYVLSVIPGDLVTEKTDRIITVALWSAIFIAAAFLALGVYVYVLDRKGKKLMQRSAAELEKLAYVDSVTGCFTWNKFKQEAEILLQKNRNEYAFAVLDIDKFKLFNDQFGYEEGNRMLYEISCILSRNTGENELYGRISGDIFCLLLLYENDGLIARRIETIISCVNAAAGKRYVTLHFGVYRPVDRSLSLRKMSDRADMGRYQVKNKSESAYAFYTDALMVRIREEKDIENEMLPALENGEFAVYFQPKIDLKKNCIAGAEALIRWIHPRKGLIPPDRFIPLFEKDGFVNKIDLYVLDQVCRKQREWIDAGYDVKVISVNISRVNLSNPHLVRDLAEILARYGVPPGLIEIEITESAVFENMEVLTCVFSQLHDAGFVTSIDDFGTGYSSLNLLKDLSVDVLKMDREFLAGTDENERGRKVIKAIIRLAVELDMKTISEGIETKKQVDFLNEVGCDLAQGFYFAKPMPVSEFEAAVFQTASKS